MNRINPFEGLVVSSEDLKYIQTSVEEYFVKALAVTSNFPETNGKGGVALGFNLLLSGTQVQVFNNNSINLGYAMDGKGRVIEFKPVSTAGVLLTPDNYNAGQPWVVAVRVVEEFGSYNPDTTGIDVGVSNRISLVESVPGESGGTQPDRVVQDYKIDVFSDIAFAEEQTATGTAWVELGRFKTNGVDTLSNVPLNLSDLDVSTVTNIAGRFTQGSVTINQISNELLPFFRELLVNLDRPTIGYFKDQKNRGSFVDSNVLLSKTDGTAMDLFAGELPAPTPRVLVRRDGSFDPAPVGISDQFGNPVFSHTFTVTAANNFGLTYNPRITHVSLYVGSLDFLSPQTSIEGRVLDSNQQVIATFSTSVNNLVAQSWNKFQLALPVTLSVNSSYSLQVRKSNSNSGFSLFAQNGIFAYRIWHRPSAGVYGTDVALYDVFGDISQVSENNDRNTAKGIVRYIPYAAVINDFATFSPYNANEEEIDEFRPESATDRTLKFVAVDVQNGRFFFTDGQAPTEDVLVKCSFKQLLFDLNASRIQRKSQDSDTYYESVESALIRLERLSNPEILVKRRGSPLIKVFPDAGGLHSAENKFRFISTDAELKDTTGVPFSADSVNLPEAQLKIDAFYNVNPGNEGDFVITENNVFPRRAQLTISYLSLAGPQDGDQLEINGIIYEFDENSSVDNGTIPVPILGTVDSTFAQLVTRVTAADPELELVQDVTNKNVKIFFKEIGGIGNGVVVRDLQDAVPSQYLFLDYLDAPTGSYVNPITTAILDGGTWGSVIPLSPRFREHTGVVLTIKKVPAIPNGNVTGFGSISVDLYAGTNYDETNLNNLVKIGPTGRITTSTVNSLTAGLYTALFVSLPADLDLDAYPNYYYRIKTDSIPQGGNLVAEIGDDIKQIGFQQLFTSAPGLATSALGYDIFDQWGSIFAPSPNRDPEVVEEISQTVFTGLLNDFTLASTVFPLQETGTEALPSFTPPTISDIYLANIEILVSSTDFTAGAIVVTVHDENNQVVGVPQSKILPNPPVLSEAPAYNSNIVSTTTSTGQIAIYANIGLVPPSELDSAVPGIPQSVHEDPNNTTYRGPVRFSVPYPAILDIRKRYHVHVQSTATDAEVVIGTNGVSGTGEKWIRIEASKAYVPIYADLSNENWENIILPDDFYVAVDPFLGRVKFNDGAATGDIPPDGNLLSNFNISIPFNALSSETLVRPDGSSVEEALNNLSSSITLVNDFEGERVHETVPASGVYGLHSRDVPLMKRGADSTIPYLPSQVGLQALHPETQQEILLEEVRNRDVSTQQINAAPAVASIDFLVASDPHGSTLTSFPLSSLYLNVVSADPGSIGNIITRVIQVSTNTQVGPDVSTAVSSFIPGFENRIPFDPEEHIVSTGVNYRITMSLDDSAANGDLELVDGESLSGQGVLDYRLFYIIPNGYYGEADGNYQVKLGGTDVTLNQIKQWPMRYPLYGKYLQLVPFIGNDKTVGFVENIHEGGAVISMEQNHRTERKFFPFEEEVVFCATKEIAGERSIDVVSKKKPKRLGYYTLTDLGAVSSSGDVITLVSHGFNNNHRLRIFDAGGTGLSTVAIYYVIAQSDDTFQLTLTPSGGNIAIGSDNSSDFEFEVITSDTLINHREYSYATSTWSDPTLIYDETEWKQDVRAVCVKNGQTKSVRSYNKIFVAVVPADGGSILTSDNYPAPDNLPVPMSLATAITGFTPGGGTTWRDVRLFIDDYFTGVNPDEEFVKYHLTVIEDNGGTEVLRYASRPYTIDTPTYTPVNTLITGNTGTLQNLDLVVTDTGYWYAAVTRNGTSASEYKHTITRGTDFNNTPVASTTVVDTANYDKAVTPADHNADEIGLDDASGNEVGNNGWRVIVGGSPAGAFVGQPAGSLAVWNETLQSWSFHQYIKFSGVFTSYREKSCRLLTVIEDSGDYTYATVGITAGALNSEVIGTVVELGEADTASAQVSAQVPMNYTPPRFFRKDLTVLFPDINSSFTEAKKLNIYERRMPIPQGKLNTVDYLDPFKRFSGLGVDPVTSHIHLDHSLGKAITSDHTVAANLQIVADDLIPNARGWSDWTDELLEKDKPVPFLGGWRTTPKILRLDKWGTYVEEGTPYITETIDGLDAVYRLDRTKIATETSEWDGTGLTTRVYDSGPLGYYAVFTVVYPEDQIELVNTYVDSLTEVPAKFLTNQSYYRTAVSEGILLADVEKT